MSKIGSQDESVKTNTDYIEKGEYSGGDRPVRSRVGKMAPTGMKFDLVKFDGSGIFGLWQTKVKDLLAQQGVSKALKGEKPAKMEDDDWEEMQLQAAATIRLCLSDQVMYHVMEETSPKIIWEMLEAQFMSKTLTNKLYLK